MLTLFEGVQATQSKYQPSTALHGLISTAHNTHQHTRGFVRIPMPLSYWRISHPSHHNVASSVAISLRLRSIWSL